MLDFFAFSLIVLAILGALWLLPEAEPIKVTGSASVLDGDSLRLHGTEVRLVGVDAPERDQMCRRNGMNWPCGDEAASALRNHVRGKSVTCEGADRDQHGRLLAVCRLGQADLNRWLVERGWAVSYGRYPAEEERARQARRGIWSGIFIPPRDWREGVR